MNTWLGNEKKVVAQQGGLDRNRAPQVAQPAPGNAMLCCDEAMKPRLVHARDRQGQTVFVAVWHCPRCGRTLS
jgi:hypothetical protein